MQNLESAYREHLAHLQRGYEAALAKHQLDAIVLSAGLAASKNRFDDQHWPLSVTPAYAHWLPLPLPECHIVIRGGQRPQLIRTVHDDYWESAPIVEADHFGTAFDVVEVTPGQAAQHFPQARAAYITRDPVLVPGGLMNPSDLLQTLDALRTQKTEYEIACMLEANRRAVRGHRAVEKAFLEGDKSELALHLTYLGASEQDDHETPYKNLIAMGPHAAVLHHAVYAKHAPGRSDNSLLVDCGAKCMGYGSDITRTYVRGGGAGARQFSSLIAAVDMVQRKLCEQLKVGLDYEALHDQSHHMLATALSEIGLLRGSEQECVAKGVTRAFFPHGLGHSVGIVTHDVGMRGRAPRSENRYLRTTATIAENNVLTIEPGVYFIDAMLAPLRADDRSKLVNWPLVDVLKAFGGVRVEDNVQVLATGTRNLTRDAFAAESGKVMAVASSTTGKVIMPSSLGASAAEAPQHRATTAVGDMSDLNELDDVF